MSFTLSQKYFLLFLHFVTLQTNFKCAHHQILSAVYPICVTLQKNYSQIGNENVKKRWTSAHARAAAYQKVVGCTEAPCYLALIILMLIDLQ